MSQIEDSLKQFAADLRQEVLLRCAVDSPQDQQECAFTEWVLEQLSEHNEADDGMVFWHKAEGRGRWPASKINAWALTGDGATLDLFVTIYYGDDQGQTVSLPEVRKQFKLLVGFLRRARDGFHTQVKDREDVFEVAKRIYESSDSLTTVRLFLLTDGIAPRIAELDETVEGLELRYVLWDLKKLSQLRVGERGVIELDFVDRYGGLVPCLGSQDNGGECQTYLAFMPGRVLAQIYAEHGQRLLERNVRAFLGKGRGVNKGMQKTLAEEPQRFLAYNNGLCCTAAEIKLEKSEDGQLGLSWVKDFQIVNGGQTTASIYHAMKKERMDITKVSVQLKLTVLRRQRDFLEIVPLISKYANSQTKVNAADLAANGKFHQEIEALSRTVFAPAVSGLQNRTHWYYERARGSYLDDKAAQGTTTRRREWEKVNPPDRKFTKTDMAKYEHAWLGLPHLVCQGAEKNFVKFAEYMESAGQPEVNLDYFRHMVAKAILWRTAEKLFDTLDLDGYRANSVAYAIAWLAEESHRRIDLDRIWQEQRVSAYICDALKTVCNSAWEYLTGQHGNIGEASKRVECWERFKLERIELPSRWQNELSPTPFVTPRTEEEAVRVHWERLRPIFFNDSRTIEGLEACTGKQWIRSFRRNLVSSFANLTWEQLRRTQGLTQLQKVRDLVEMLGIAAEEESDK